MHLVVLLPSFLVQPLRVKGLDVSIDLWDCERRAGQVEEPSMLAYLDELDEFQW